ncbi:MAG TPA: FAD-binding protein, partial [Longimicrobiaceae bacterium]|nr:FAD-binding protein [Longimicrobiaceae bacterium]
MPTPQEFARRAAWFPLPEGSRATGAASAGGDGLVTNAYLWSSLPLADQAALREINVTLTGMAIEQCASGGGAANQVDFGSLFCLALAEFAEHDVGPDDLLELSAERDVVFPWSLLYGNARTPFNFRLARLPLVIAYPRTVDDVVFWVGWVRDHRLTVSIRSGNNSYEGLSSANRVIVDLTFLTLGGEDDPQYRIDADGLRVHTASGVRLGVLYTALSEQGLALAGGQCAPVCVGGLVGTGGIGFATRYKGWACDQLVEVECVLADGSVVVANAGNEHADLYRACKGAGAAGLCVMTRLTLQLFRPAGVIFYSVSFGLTEDTAVKDGAVVTEAWQNLVNAPDGLSSVLAATASTGGAESLLSVNGEFWFDATDHDPEAAVRDALRTHFFAYLPDDLRPDDDEVLTQRMTPAEAGTVAALLVPMPIFSQWKLKSRSTFEMADAETLAPLFESLTTPPVDDTSKCVGYHSFWILGGASNRIDPESAVVPVRDGAVMWVHSGAQWNDPSVEADALAWVEDMFDVVDDALGSDAAFYGIPELELGSQLTDPPDLGYLEAY